MLSDEPKSLDELAATLGVSKASVSIEARRLLERGVVARVGRPADRKDYYVLATDFFSRLVAHRVARWTAFHDLVADMRGDASARGTLVQQRFDHVRDIHGLVTSRIADALGEWTARSARVARSASGKRTGRGARSRSHV
jgi:DNA-binding MarR family transcriptional regulator